MITKLPVSWHIVITEETIDHINKHRAKGGSMYSNPVHLEGSPYYTKRELYNMPVWLSECDPWSVELSLLEFRVLVLKDLKIDMKSKLKMFKI
jgi:hypothetical protein